MALVAAEPPSCSLIPTCSVLRALAGLITCLFVSPLVLCHVKRDRSQVTPCQFWDTLGAYPACVWMA